VSLLHIENVSKSYRVGKNPVNVLHDINLQITRGEFVAFMGRSGAGKSTLLNILGLLDSEYQGTYLLEGIDVSTLKERRRASFRGTKIGFVFQGFNLLPKLNLAENIELPLIYCGVKRKARKARVEQLMEQFGLADRARHRPGEISGGQKQRVAIARALAPKPAIILADEPTGNLDSTTTGDILQLLKDVHQQGNTLLLITHEDDVARVAQRTIYLKDGKIVTSLS